MSPSIFTLPMSPKYSFNDAENTYFYIPNAVVSEKPTEIKSNSSKRLDLEWVPHTTSSALTYLGVAISSICYYVACFLRQYGNRSVYRRNGDWLGEEALTRVVMVQWLIISALLLTGLFFYRRVFMPIYIFLAVLATNGTVVMFILKLKQYFDGYIDIMDISLNLIGVLLFCSIIHNLIYFYAMYLQLIVRKSGFFPSNISAPSPIYNTVSPPPYYAEIPDFSHA